MTDWLDELYQLHEEDKAKQQEEKLDLSILGKTRPTSTGILRHSNALNLLRRVQKALLSGKGVVEVLDYSGEYDHSLALVWQGPISAARKPNPNDPEPYQYIFIGAKDAKLYVNGKEINPPHPENLKAALVEAAKKPSKAKPKIGSSLSKKAQMCYNRLVALRLFVSVMRWVQKVAPWLHLPHFDRWIVKVWKFLIDLLLSL